MQPFDIMPINFSLTDRAAGEINRLTNYLSQTEGKPMVASLLWNEEYEEAERRLVDRGFVLGWYELSECPKDAIQSVNGTELLFVVTAKQAEKFSDKTIDFVDGKFRFG
jgi:hypothetical protein